MILSGSPSQSLKIFNMAFRACFSDENRLACSCFHEEEFTTVKPIGYSHGKKGIFHARAFVVGDADAKRRRFSPTFRRAGSRR
jgi:hypothetical protein